MQSSDHVHFSNTKGKRFADDTDDLINRIFKRVSVAFFRGESAELAGEDADVGVVDVAIVDVGGVVAIPAFPHCIGDHANRVKIF